MTLNELGLQLREIYPHLKTRPGSHTQLAQLFLQSYPEYYDLLSPVARKIHEVSHESFESQRWTERGRLESEDLFENTRKKRLENLHLADMLMEATQNRTPVTALHDITIESHKTNEFIRKEKAIVEIGLSGNERASLKPHQLIRLLEAELEALITKRDNESHPEKREDLTEAIAFKREELRGRRNQALVSVGRNPLGHDENPNGTGSGGESLKGDVEPVSGSHPRMGF